MEDPNKLPKWARHRIEKLEADLAYFKKQLFQMETPGESNTYIRLGLEKRALPRDSWVIFLLGQDNGLDKIEVGIDPQGFLNIQGWDAIDIRPRASNAILLSLVKKGG